MRRYPTKGPAHFFNHAYSKENCMKIRSVSFATMVSFLSIFTCGAQTAPPITPPGSSTPTVEVVVTVPCNHYTWIRWSSSANTRYCYMQHEGLIEPNGKKYVGPILAYTVRSVTCFNGTGTGWSAHYPIAIVPSTINPDNPHDCRIPVRLKDDHEEDGSVP